jgi:hypothetical protein
VESNFVTLVEMGSCFDVPLSHIVCKEFGCMEEVELWAPYSLSFPKLW